MFEPSEHFSVAAIGSFPGRDPREPARIQQGETPHIPSVAELPQRGVGADMIGRTLGMLAQIDPSFTAETTPSGWRLTKRSNDAHTRVMRRAQQWLADDIAVAEEYFSGAPHIKCSLTGPWTLAAHVDLANGHKLVSDPGALRDVEAAFIEACRFLCAKVQPIAPPILQVDEPSLGAVLQASIPTPSGMDRYRAVAADQIRSTMLHLREEVTVPVLVHSCAVPAPVDLLAEIADAIAVDLSQQNEWGTSGQSEDALAHVLERGTPVLVGIVAVAESGPIHRAEDNVDAIIRLMHRIGLGLDSYAPLIGISTPCGLAGVSPHGAQRAMQTVARVADILRKEVR